MTRYCLLYILSIATAIFHLSGCQHDSISATSQRLRVSQIKRNSFYAKGDSVSLQYGATGKLVSYTAVTSGYLVVGTLNYNEKGQLTRSEEKPAPGVISYSNYRTYTYNQEGNLTTTEFYATSYGKQIYSLRRVDKLEYNDIAQPVRMTTTTYMDGQLISISLAESSFRNGNVESVKIINPVTQHTTITTFQYDDEPNPFYGLTEHPVGFINSTYNRNNTSARLGGLEEDVSHALTYDANGLLIKQVLNANLKSSRQISYTYKYESY